MPHAACGKHPKPPPTEPPGPQPLNFLSLPIEIRNNIYQRLLSMRDEIRIFQDPGCSLEAFLPERPPAWNALVYTNRQISSEARAILYRMNRFFLPDTSFARRYRGSIVQSFLSGIGPINAACLSYACIHFPELEMLDGSEEIKLPEYALQDFRRLQIECTQLRMLEISIYDEETYKLLKEDRIISASVRNGFIQIAEHIKGIQSLNKVIARIYNGVINDTAKDFLQDLGWTVLID